MTFQDLRQRAAPFIHPVRINGILSQRFRVSVLQILSSSVIIGLVLAGISLFTPLPWFSRFIGFSVFMLGCALAWFALVSYVFSAMVRGDDEKAAMTFEVATIALTSDRHDLTAGFLGTPGGRRTWNRLGLTREDRQTFYVERAETVATLQMPEELKRVDLEAYTRALVDADKDLQEFLRSRRITVETFAGAAVWAQREMREDRNSYRWWSYEHLRRYPGIGADWHFGETPILDSYSSSAADAAVYRAGADEYYRDGVDSLETALSRSRHANALLIGQAGSGLREAVAVLARRIKSGTVTPQLEGTQIRLIEAGLLTAIGSKDDVEKTLLTILNETTKAGDVILVIEHLPSFLSSLEELGISGIDIIEPYLEASRVRVIATATPGTYHSYIERNDRLKNWFDEVRLSHDEQEQTTRLLEDRVKLHEAKAGGDIFVTYPAVEALYSGAKRYLVNGVMPNAALDLLDEVVSTARNTNRVWITRSFVNRTLEEKTGIPAGEVHGEEREKLLGLDELLHKRIVGQEAAVQAVSNALRRSRSGIADPDHPLGVFLFLGPTGVGKTETAKVLADTMFDGRDDMIRIDMSEFSGPDAIERLIGSESAKTSGTLSVAVQDNPYSVLLLDEFEKANPDVHDLFLQIFDEGVFHDAYGKEVNLRNMILIATSNAAAQSIRSFVKGGESLTDHQDDIVNELIEGGVFRPELINRFDEVVLFHPLATSEARDVSERELAKLQARLNERGVTFEITESLVDYLVENGYDEQFGARSIRRIINSDIERVISHKLITGEVKPGDTVVVTEKDLSSLSKKGKRRQKTLKRREASATEGNIPKNA